MAKKIYIKPDAEHIVFYSKEEITASYTLGDGMAWQTIEQQANEGGVGGNISGNIGVGGGSADRED